MKDTHFEDFYLIVSYSNIEMASCDKVVSGLTITLCQSP